jgi:hypothetical protein
MPEPQPQTYTEDPYQRIVNVHWKTKPPKPPEPENCDQGCDEGYHEIPTQNREMAHQGEFHFFYLQPYEKHVFTGTGFEDIKQAFVYEPRYIPPHDMPGDPQQTYLYAACVERITISLVIDTVQIGGMKYHDDLWIAVWWRPGIQVNSLNHPGDMKIWIAEEISPGRYEVFGPRYTPTFLTYSKELNFTISGVAPEGIETEGKPLTLPYTLPRDPGILGVTIQIQVGTGSVYPWTGEPFPPAPPSGGYSASPARRAGRIPILNTMKPTRSRERMVGISPLGSGVGWLNVTMKCGSATPSERHPLRTG